MAGLYNVIDQYADHLRGSFVLIHYASKGNQSGKDSIDRISGSGVFARDPDSIVTMTKHEEDGAFVVEPVLRNLPPIEPFCVAWGPALLFPGLKQWLLEPRQPWPRPGLFLAKVPW